MFEKGEEIDWATAEALAFATLMQEGNTVRLSGQDAQRGTFSHRHAVLHDQNSDSLFTPLSQFQSDKATFTVANSPLSEYGVMGFDLGYSLESPDQLILWEAQFGDFVNGAQIILDQFLSSGETKWYRMSGLTLLLPHGYDGQGPEHSSCRVERFLQMVDEDEDIVPTMKEGARFQIQRSNWQVVNVTTPAQYFHVLRRQVHRDFRKPLIVVSPKSLLRHRQCVSNVEEMGPGTRFRRFLPDDGSLVTDAKKVRKLLLCSGKLYYELHKARAEGEHSDIAIARVEQL
ncbi:ogdh, partial [Symbiodinium sp. KB8]